MANRYKLRKKKKTTVLKVFLIIFLVLFFVMMFLSYKYMIYKKANDIDVDTYKDVFSFLNDLGNKYDVSLPLNISLIKEMLDYQLKLWYVYAISFFLIFLLASGRNKDEYRGVEHGSADWADKYDEKYFKDKKGIPVARNFYVTTNRDKKDSYITNNLNEIIIGGPGAGKTLRKITPDIINCQGSIILTDPKGELYRHTAKLLKRKGYKVRVLNLIDINLSNTYNPFAYIESEQDVLNVANLFMQNTAGEGEKEDFWVGSAQKLLTAIMLYLYKSESETKSFNRAVKLVNSISYKDGKIDPTCELARCLIKHKIENDDEIVVDAVNILWGGFKGSAEVTLAGIVENLSTRLRLWVFADVAELTDNDEMDFDKIGIEKTAIFLLIPPARQTYKVIANLFFSQLIERLQYIAMKHHEGRLPLLTSIEIDEFANIGKIPNFNEHLSVVRSFNIRIAIVLQDINQLKAMYEKQWESIIGNCSIFTYLGTNDKETKDYVVKRLGKTTVRVDSRSYSRSSTGGGGSDSESYISRDLLTTSELGLAMKPAGKNKKYGGSCIVFIDEFKPFFLNKFDIFGNVDFQKYVGGPFKNQWDKNSYIEEDYKYINHFRKERYRSDLIKAREREETAEMKALRREKEEENNKQAQLKNSFDSALGKNQRLLVEELFKDELLEENQKELLKTLNNKEKEVTVGTEFFDVEINDLEGNTEGGDIEIFNLNPLLKNKFNRR